MNRRWYWNARHQCYFTTISGLNKIAELKTFAGNTVEGKHLPDIHVRNKRLITQHVVWVTLVGWQDAKQSPGQWWFAVIGWWRTELFVPSSRYALCDDTTRSSHSPRQSIYGWQKFTPFENHLYRINTRTQACVNNNDLTRMRLMYNWSSLRVIHT